mgnify:CR=1 FL=1
MKKNFVYQFVYQVLTIVIPFITTPYVSRILGAEGIGIYSYTYAVVNYFVLLGRMGIQMYGNRQIAMQNGDKTKISECFWNLFFVHLILSVFSIVAFAFFVTYTEENRKMFFIQGIYLIGQMMDINWLFFGLEKFKLTVTRNVIVKMISLINIFIFVKSSSDLWKYILILALGSTFGESMVWIAVPKYVSLCKPRWSEMKTYFKPIIKFFIPVIATSIYTLMDKVFIKYYCDASQVGYYENAEKIVSVGRLVTVALGTVALPNATRLVTIGKNINLKQSIDKSLFASVWFAVAFFYGISGIATNFVPLFLGEEFRNSICIVYELLPCIFCWAIANVFRTQYVIPKQKDNVYIGSQIVAAIVNFVFNLVLIPCFGTAGAAIGTVVAELTVCVAMVIASKNVINFKKKIFNFMWLNTLGIVMFIVIKRIEKIEVNVLVCTIIQILVGGTVYLILSMLIIWYGRRKVWRSN